MKKLVIIFMGALMALMSCKTQTDGLASANDVYYNPATDRKPNVAPQTEQYAAKQAVDPNAGKIAATEADKNNPYYQDPNFNYDDYYDNAYAARIRRFNNPIYGTGYYDTYNTNSYFYNGNPSCYGNSIYSSYNMGYGGYNNYNSGWGYYSPSASFWNSYYNPYYNGFGNGYNAGFNNGFNMGMSYGYGNGPWGMGMGYGGYNPYGYSPYGFGGGYGYSPYGNYNPYGGYYNSYDFNSSSYSNYGPRGSHTGGNSHVTSPVTGPGHMVVNKPTIEGPPGTSPYNTERFSKVALSKDHYTKVVEAKNPVNNAINSPMNNQPSDGRPMYNSGATKGNNGGNVYNGGTYNNTTTPGNTNTGTPVNEGRPKKWLSTGGGDNGGNTGGGNTGGGNTGGGTRGGSVIQINGGGNTGGTNGGGIYNGGSNTGGGVARPRK